MINRIVRMSFEPQKVEDFLAFFETVKSQIAAFEGCEGLILLRDAQLPNVFCTYSYWQSEVHLNNYRYSPLFKDTWSKTKSMFSDKAQAWSLLLEQKVK